MGCAFNMHSHSWSDRSYGITLFLYCWICPLLIIFCSYIGIIYHTHISRKTLLELSISVIKPAKEKEQKQKGQLNGSGLNISPYSPQRASVTL